MSALNLVCFCFIRNVKRLELERCLQRNESSWAHRNSPVASTRLSSGVKLFLIWPQCLCLRDCAWRCRSPLTSLNLWWEKGCLMLSPCICVLQLPFLPPRPWSFRANSNNSHRRYLHHLKLRHIPINLPSYFKVFKLHALRASSLFL